MLAFEDFERLSVSGNVVPVFDTLLADTETPVSVYLKLRSLSPFSFLLESVEGGESIGRYSFIGVDPFMVFRIHGRSFEIDVRHEDVCVLPKLVSPNDHPLKALNSIFRHFKTVHVPGLPRLTGGAVGYFGYESIRLVEDVPCAKVDDTDLPDASLLFCDTVLIFDNVRREVFLVSNGYIPEGERSPKLIRSEYDKAIAEIERLRTCLLSPLQPPLLSPRSSDVRVTATPREQFESWVRRSQDFIRAGDIFQVVLSQRIRRPFSGDTFTLYRNLRRINPSPYMYYIDMDGLSIIGSSPEMLVRVEGKRVETRPIAGTRRRGASKTEDEALRKELSEDEKERAEHLMLVDLGRNDLGRICAYGSAKVDEFMSVEAFSHVMHLVSTVSGELRPDVSALDALYACFPAGTLSGAPKIRAMEIIAELEPIRRGVYGGAVGYIDFSGNMDSCIAIRTIVAHAGMVSLQAGAGIVADSRPEREYQETMEKLAATLRAVEESTSSTGDSTV